MLLNTPRCTELLPTKKELLGPSANSAEVRKSWREKETEVGERARGVKAKQVVFGTRES